MKHGLVTPTELETGEPDPGSVKAVPALTAAVAARRLGRGIPSSRDPKVPPQFKVGQRVRIQGGCLQGLEGVLAQSEERRLVISIESIRRAVAIEIEGYELEPI